MGLAKVFMTDYNSEFRGTKYVIYLYTSLNICFLLLLLTFTVFTLQAAIVCGAAREQLRSREPAGPVPCIQPFAGNVQHTRHVRGCIFERQQRHAGCEHCRQGACEQGAERAVTRHHGPAHTARWFHASSQLASSMILLCIAFDYHADIIF